LGHQTHQVRQPARAETTQHQRHDLKNLIVLLWKLLNFDLIKKFFFLYVKYSK